MHRGSVNLLLPLQRMSQIGGLAGGLASQIPQAGGSGVFGAGDRLGTPFCMHSDMQVRQLAHSLQSESLVDRACSVQK